jgi:hypothetical protein
VLFNCLQKMDVELAEAWAHLSPPSHPSPVLLRTPVYGPLSNVHHQRILTKTFPC